MRIVFALTFWLLALPTYAQPVLRLFHLQHHYAGGGGCVERFWMEWESSDSEISNLELSIEMLSKGEENMTGFLRVERLGTHAMDNSVEVMFETPRCLSGRPRIIVRTASGNLEGAKIDLLKHKSLLIGKVEQFPISINGLTHHSTGPAQKAAQAGGFKR